VTPLDKITRRLTWLLRLHGKHGGKARRINYTSLPLATDLKFEGTPLRSIMSPPVPDDPFECEQIFDTWVSPMQTGEGNSARDLAELAGTALVEFITLEASGRSLSFQEVTVRLLYALGNAKGACLVYSPRTIEVFHGDRTYGITDGVVSSRFCEGFNLGEVAPTDTLERVELIRTFDRHFCSLYREAYRRGKGLPQAIIALHMGNPGFNWRRLAEAARPGQRPTYAKLMQWENMLLKRDDPIHALYLAMVPLWVTTAEFSKAVGRLSSRPINPTPQQRQFCITKLHTYFHKNR